MCVTNRVMKFVGLLSDLQPWQGGYERLEQALLSEIQSSAGEVTEGYGRVTTLHKKLCVGNQKDQDMKYPTLPGWISNLNLMQTKYKEKVICSDSESCIV